MTRRGVWGELNRLDTAVYAAVARTPTPDLNEALRAALERGGRLEAVARKRFGACRLVASEAPVPGGLLAALVAYSRVHTGVHHPSDVVAGAVIGAALSPIAAAAAKRHRVAEP